MLKPAAHGMYILVACFSLFINSSCSKHSNPSRNDAAVYSNKTISLSSMSVDIINLVNQVRQVKHLPALKLLQAATNEATSHSQDMASKKVPFGHDGFNNRAIVLANELNGSSATGENVASGRMTAKEVIAAWLRSPAHRANIEGDFTYTGVGVAKDSRGVVYYTQLFVKK